MAEVLLGIDVGTSAVKAGLFTAEGRLLGTGRAPCRTEQPRTGWSQADPEQWWRAALAAMRQACSEAGLKPSQVSALSCGVLFPAVMPLDADARPLAPAILYNDARSLQQVSAIERTLGRQAYEETIANRLVPGTCAVTSILWLRDQMPEVYRRAHRIGFVNTFLVARLTGEFCADPSMVGLSGLAEGANPWAWSEPLCEALGIEPALLPRVVGSGELAGAVSRRAAAQTGLCPGTPVACGGGDVPVCAFGAGVLKPGQVAYIAGSTDCVAAPLRAPDKARLWANTAHVERDLFLAIGTTTSSGVSVAWFVREVLGLDEPDGLEAMTRIAATAPPGSGGALFVPYLQGERTPIWDPLARGAFFGLTSRTTRAELSRAVLEGTALALRHVMEHLPSPTQNQFSELRCVGGGTKNELWNTIKASALNVPLQVLEFQETGILGAALLAGLAAGTYTSAAQGIEVARHCGGVRTVPPDPALVRVYEELFPIYRDLYPATRPHAHALARHPTSPAP